MASCRRVCACVKLKNRKLISIWLLADNGLYAYFGGNRKCLKLKVCFARWERKQWRGKSPEVLEENGQVVAVTIDPSRWIYATRIICENKNFSCFSHFATCDSIRSERFWSAVLGLNGQSAKKLWIILVQSFRFFPFSLSPSPPQLPLNKQSKKAIQRIKGEWYLPNNNNNNINVNEAFVDKRKMVKTKFIHEKAELSPTAKKNHFCRLYFRPPTLNTPAWFGALNRELLSEF